jgi:glutamine synthetase
MIGLNQKQNNTLNSYLDELISCLADEFFLLGLSPKLGIELEFYLKGPQQALSEFIATSPIEIIKERGQGQFEIALPPTANILSYSDEFEVVKENLSQHARTCGLDISFAAKPYQQDFGSAIHLHLSLHEGLKNTYAEGGVEENAKLLASIAGILEVTPQSVYLLNQVAEDYLRFMPNFMAPTHHSWGGNNRTTIIRIPQDQENRRIEFRLPPANANIRLAIYIVLYGALYGLKHNLRPQPRTWGNAFDSQYNLKNLPNSLKAANLEFKNGNHFIHLAPYL